MPTAVVAVNQEEGIHTKEVLNIIVLAAALFAGAAVAGSYFSGSAAYACQGGC